MKSTVKGFAKSFPPKSFPACALALAVFMPACGAQAARYRVLHTFLGSQSGDGADPWAPLMQDRAGNLYGTTLAGGTDNEGTVFTITPGGTEAVLHSFHLNSPNGELPHDGLIMDKKGNLYGTATYGGDANSQGIVFRLAPDGTETVLYTFKGGPGDGNYPYGALFMDKKGTLYGTTVAGGTNNDGTIFKLAPDGTESVLHSFTNSPNDGSYPVGNLIRDQAGNLYGTTPSGGASDVGTVFRVAPHGYAVLFAFANAVSDGAHPNPGLIIDKAGNLYGSTYSGGSNNAGVVFRLALDGTETVLHTFTGAPADGQYPVGSLIMDKAGNLYGATFSGGANDVGSVFKLASDGTVTVLHSFCQKQNCYDGAWPMAGVIQDKSGNLYGTTSLRGEYANGTVYRITSPISAPLQ